MMVMRIEDDNQGLFNEERDGRKAATPQEQDVIQRELSELERKQRCLRQEIFTVEDEIIAKRDELIASLQQRLQEKTSIETLFSIRWQGA